MALMWSLTWRSMPASWLARSLRGRWRSSQGCEHFIWQAVAAYQGGAYMPAEYRRAMGADARVAAGQLPAVLAKPTPQRGLAGLCQRVSADADDPGAAVRAVLAVFEEEIDSLWRTTGTAGAVPQTQRPAYLGGQLIQDPVELIGV